MSAPLARRAGAVKVVWASESLNDTLMPVGLDDVRLHAYTRSFWATVGSVLALPSRVTVAPGATAWSGPARAVGVATRFEFLVPSTR